MLNIVNIIIIFFIRISLRRGLLCTLPAIRKSHLLTGFIFIIFQRVSHMTVMCTHSLFIFFLLSPSLSLSIIIIIASSSSEDFDIDSDVFRKKWFEIGINSVKQETNATPPSNSSSFQNSPYYMHSNDYDKGTVLYFMHITCTYTCFYICCIYTVGMPVIMYCACMCIKLVVTENMFYKFIVHARLTSCCTNNILIFICTIWP